MTARGGINILRWERDLLILTGGLWESFKIDARMRDDRQNYGELRLKPGVIGINILTVAGWRDCVGMTGLSQM